MTFESTSSDDVLKYSMNVLKKIYKTARKKEDLTVMMAVADRLLVLFEGLSDLEKIKKHQPTGFARLVMEEEDD
jgi:hypothetical protein